MKSKIKHTFNLAVGIILISFTATGFAQEKTDAKKDSSGGAQQAKLIGGAAFLTNFIEHGVSQTNGGAAFQGRVGYRWAQTELNFWGSNVKYVTTNDESLNFRINAAYKFNVAAGIESKLQYTASQFFKSSGRNNTTLNIDTDIYGYVVGIERGDNWWNSGGSLLGLSLKKTFSLPYDFQWMIMGRYNVMTGSSRSSFFDVATSIDYKWYDFLYGINLTYNSVSSDYGDDGATAFYLSIRANFN